MVEGRCPMNTLKPCLWTSRRAPLVRAFLGALLILTGCGGGSGQGSGHHTSTQDRGSSARSAATHPPVSVTPANSPATSPQPDGSATPSAKHGGSPAPSDRTHVNQHHVSACRTSQLQISIAGANGGGGHIGFALRFTNNGARCALRGYPGVDGPAANGRTFTPTGPAAATSAAARTLPRLSRSAPATRRRRHHMMVRRGLPTVHLGAPERRSRTFALHRAAPVAGS